MIATDLPGARKRARAADRALKNGDVWGPFHGLPMTVKGILSGCRSADDLGIASFQRQDRDQKCAGGRSLAGVGRGHFGKTNVPVMLADGQRLQSGLWRNQQSARSQAHAGRFVGRQRCGDCAGLSGIETGSDIASSIRNPAHNNGIFGHKPTYGLCPPRGHSLGDAVVPADISVIGRWRAAQAILSRPSMSSPGRRRSRRAR